MLIIYFHGLINQIKMNMNILQIEWNYRSEDGKVVKIIFENNRL